MFKKLKKWLKAKIREIKDRRIIRLGGFTKKQFDTLRDACGDVVAATRPLTKMVEQIRFAQSEIAIDPKYGYTRENIIEASKAQTMFRLGQEVYKYANHSITNDGTYLCTVTVMHMDVSDRLKEDINNG